MKQLIAGLYALVIAIILLAIGYSSSHLFEIAGDSLRYTFGDTGWDYAKFNYHKGTGRWAQGLTNDYRLYKIRGIMAALSTGVFLYGAFVFFRYFVRKPMEALVVTVTFYLATIFSLVRFYDFTFNMAMVMSYTLGLGIILGSIPMLVKNAAQFRLWRFRLLAIVALVTAGLLEIHGVVFGLIIIGLLVYYGWQERRWHRWMIVLVLISLAGNLFTYMSPGNVARRARNEGNAGFDMDVFLQIAGTVFDKLFQVGSIVFFGLVILMALFYNGNHPKLKMSKQHWLLLLFGGLLGLVPMLLIVLAVGDKATNFNRVLNMSTVYLLLFFFGILWLGLRRLGWHLPVLKKLYHPALLACLAASVSLYFLVDSLPAKNVYRQIATGEMLNYQMQEQARRDYLLAQPNEGVKRVPTLDQREFQENVMGLRNEHKFPAGFKMHHTYNHVFNKGRNVELVKTLPNPCVYTSIYFYNNDGKDRASLLLEENGLKVYYFSKYDCILLSRDHHGFPKTLNFQEGSEEKIVTIADEIARFPEFYKKDPNLVGFVLNSKRLKDSTQIKEALSLHW